MAVVLDCSLIIVLDLNISNAIGKSLVPVSMFGAITVMGYSFEGK